ncbi:hypothetical protein WG66_000944 [Moniliophthora roreri]|nr:hypothetical protein WG66_000944 [Moniliophthora roreri]
MILPPRSSLAESFYISYSQSFTSTVTRKHEEHDTVSDSQAPRVSPTFSSCNDEHIHSISDIPNHRSSEQHRSRCPEERVGVIPSPPIVQLPQSQMKRENPHATRRRRGRRTGATRVATPISSPVTPDSSSTNDPVPPETFLDGTRGMDLIPTREDSRKGDSDSGNPVAPLHSSTNQDVNSTDGWFHTMYTMQNTYFVTGIHPSGGPLSNLTGHLSSFSFVIVCFFSVPFIFCVSRVFQTTPAAGSGTN